jgi:hypothetical protein
MGQL